MSDTSKACKALSTSAGSADLRILLGLKKHFVEGSTLVFVTKPEQNSRRCPKSKKKKKEREKRKVVRCTLSDGDF